MYIELVPSQGVSGTKKVKQPTLCPDMESQVGDDNAEPPGREI